MRAVPGVGRAGDDEWANKGIDHKSAPQRVRLAAKAAPYRVWSSLTFARRVEKQFDF